MRFISGQGWVHYFDETNGDGDGNGATGGAAGGADDAAGGADDDAAAGGGTDDAGAEAGKTDDAAAAAAGAKGEPKTMEEAIAAGLAKTAPKVEKTDAEKQAEAAAAAAAADKHPNGQPKKDAKGNELDDKGQITKAAAAPKAKTAAELDLTPEEKKVLGARAQARFADVITTLKTREAEIKTLTEQVTPLKEARDSILGMMNETGTSSDALAAYLEFNRLLGSNKATDLETALTMVEQQRAALYTALGREPDDGGVDLLKDFPDLKQKVAEAQITREDALEIASGRRERAAAQARTEAANKGAQTQQQLQAARTKGQNDITAWSTELARTDIDYKAKEERLLEQVDEVIKNYPPNQWLPTLKLIYKGLVISKAAPTVDRTKQPLRPTGAKPGAKAPQNMFEAMWGTGAPK